MRWYLHVCPMKKVIKDVARVTEKLLKKNLLHCIFTFSASAAFNISLAVGTLMYPKVVCSF